MKVEMQDPVRVAQLMTKFPNLSHWLIDIKHAGNLEFEPFQTLAIRFEHADENLTFELTDAWKDGQDFAWQTDGSDVIGCQRRKFYRTMDKAHNPIMNIVPVSWFHAQDQKYPQLKLPQLLDLGLSIDTVFDLLSYKTDLIEYLEYVELCSWCRRIDTRGHIESILGQANVVIYQAPKQGFVKMLAERDLLKNVRLETPNLRSRSIESMRGYIQMKEELARCVTLLQERMWNAGGMRDLVLLDNSRSFVEGTDDVSFHGRGWFQGIEITALRKKVFAPVPMSAELGSTEKVWLKLKYVCESFEQDDNSNQEYIILEPASESAGTLQLKDIHAKLTTVKKIVNCVSHAMQRLPKELRCVLSPDRTITDFDKL